MTPFASALPLLLALTATPAPPPSVHSGRGADDVRHVMVSFAAVAQGTAALRWVGLERGGAEAAAVGVAAALGIGKEVWDRAHGGRFDPLDLAWDAVGIALGGLLASAAR